ncbi:MAG: glycosyltransferase [bacterium]|nr:glycosyltransferase [bacterium]
MSEQSLVSIIIPAYNVEGFIKNAVESALGQTYSNIEIIVVDDGSTDKTEDILSPYIKEKKIKYIRQSNLGLAGARNTGIKEAQGKYIALLDADDEFLPEKIKKQVKALEVNPDYGICYCDIIHFFEGNPRKFYHHRYTYQSGNLFEPLLEKQFINPLSVVIRKDVLAKWGVFDPELRHTEDWELWLRLSHAGIKFYYLDEPLALYQVRTSGNLSIIQNEPKMKENGLKVFTRLEKSLSEEEKGRYRFKEIIDSLKLKTALAYLMIGDKKKAKNYIQNQPFILKLLITFLPSQVWQTSLRLARRIKHRFLLKKYS